MKRGTVFFGVLAIVFAPMLAWPALASQAGASAQLDANALVRRAVQNRLDASRNHQPMRYTLHVHDERHDTTKQIVETRDGDVARLVAINGKPPSADADQAELARLDNLAAHPELQEHRKRSEQKGPFTTVPEFHRIFLVCRFCLADAPPGRAGRDRLCVARRILPCLYVLRHVLRRA